MTTDTTTPTVAPAVAVAALLLAFVVGQSLTIQPWPVRAVAAAILTGTVVWLAVTSGWVRR